MEISIHELKGQLETEELVLLDVREADELENGILRGAVAIPMGEVPDRIGELDPSARTVVICRTGNRSRRVTQYLAANGFSNVANLTEGMNGWAAEVDPSFKIY